VRNGSGSPSGASGAAASLAGDDTELMGRVGHDQGNANRLGGYSANRMIASLERLDD
jgi:hypothetical protein